MAKSQNAFIKQENEKKRLKKRKDKLQKKEERKYLQELYTKEYLEHKDQVAAMNKRYFAAQVYDQQVLIKN